MRTVKVYSVSTQEGDVLIDSEDYDTLTKGLCEGVGVMRGLQIAATLQRDGVHEANAMLRQYANVTITEEEYDDTPRCDDCSTTMEECERWCGECGCCVEHCQNFVGCVKDGDDE
jgi:hypothetical protein